MKTLAGFHQDPLEHHGCASRETVQSRLPGRAAALPAFTLVEVVIALGIFIFAVVAIVGLFVVGINGNKDSSDQIQAANLASLLISTRRALPTNTITNFALPALNVAYSGTGTYVMGVAADGTVGTATDTPAYNLFYQSGTTTTAGAHLAQVHLLLWWPTAVTTPANSPGNRYELTTQVALP